MRTFEHYHDAALQESLRQDTEREIRRWERDQRRLKQQDVRNSWLFGIFVVLWAIFICLVLIIHGSKTPKTEIPVETVHEMETIETAYLTYDKPEPVVDPVAEHQEAAEPESPFYREDIPLSYEHQEQLYAACAETGIDYELALAVVWKETTFRNIIGDGGESFGFMQVQPKWHADRMERLGVDDLMVPADNFRVGCDYLAELLGKYELAAALTCYNTGSPGHNEYADLVIGKWGELK